MEKKLKTVSEHFYKYERAQETLTLPQLLRRAINPNTYDSAVIRKFLPELGSEIDDLGYGIVHFKALLGWSIAEDLKKYPNQCNHPILSYICDGLKEGDTPLHLAAFNNHAGVIKELMEAKADIRVSNRDGETPLHIAVGRNHLDAVAELLKHGVNIHAHTKWEGNYPLHLAALLKYPKKMMELLMSKGADVKVVNKRKQTVLLTYLSSKASSFNYPFMVDPNLVEWLVKKGVPMNSQDQDGDTALHYTASMGASKSTGILLRHGADPNIKTPCTTWEIMPRPTGPATPIQLTKSQDVAEILVQYGAEIPDKLSIFLRREELVLIKERKMPASSTNSKQASESQTASEAKLLNRFGLLSVSDKCAEETVDINPTKDQKRIASWHSLPMDDRIKDLEDSIRILQKIYEETPLAKNRHQFERVETYMEYLDAHFMRLCTQKIVALMPAEALLIKNYMEKFSTKEPFQICETIAQIEDRFSENQLIEKKFEKR